jgi:RsiW-degrading membrane proteinase PrsW (M82 family)
MPTRSQDIIYLSGSPLLRPRIGGVVLILLILLILLGVYGFVQQLPIFADTSLLRIYLLALLTAAFLSLPAIILLWYLDRREREPAWLYWGALLWGVVVASGLIYLLSVTGTNFITTNAFGLSPTQLEGLANDDVLVLLDDSPNFLYDLAGIALLALQVPIVQELMKGLALLLLALLMRSEFNGVRDGIVYGGLIGLGFQITETAIHATNTFFGLGGYGAIEQFIDRFSLLGLETHFLYTALLGVGLGLAVQAQGTLTKALYALGGLFMAFLAHGIHTAFMPFAFGMVDGLLTAMRESGLFPGQNFPITMGFVQFWLSTAIASLTLQFFPLLVLSIALVQSGRWERRIIREQLMDEVGRAITLSEYRQLQNESVFGLRRVRGYPRRIAKQIVNAQNNLAFRKWGVQQEGGSLLADPLIQAWREQIMELRSTHRDRYRNRRRAYTPPDQPVDQSSR